MAEYDSLAADYDLWAADMIDDVQWYVSLARDAGEPIVELGIGTGRVAIPIARETGKRVLGIDRSPAMLAVGREKAGDLPIEFREGDMRQLAVEEPVDLIICPGRSLMHCRTWAEKRSTNGDVISLRWMTRAEQEGLIDVAGLELEALHGGCHREPYDDTTYEMVWVARKP